MALLIAAVAPVVACGPGGGPDAAADRRDAPRDAIDPVDASRVDPFPEIDAETAVDAAAPPDDDGPDDAALADGATRLPRTRIVNQRSGPYRTIGAAVLAANDGDTIEITDSAVYREQVALGPSGRNAARVTIVGREGEQPVIQGADVPGDGSVVSLAAPGCALRNVTVEVAGARYGVDALGAGTVIDGVSFDVRTAPRSGNETFGLHVGADATVRGSSFLGGDSATARSGGIVASGSQPAALVVTGCDFWGIGVRGGAIGSGLPAGATVAVTGSVFGAGSTAQSIIGINSWGAATLTESRNVFRNIVSPIGRAFGVERSATDRVTSGAAAPADAAAAIAQPDVADLVRALGCTPATSFAAPDAPTLARLLRRVVISDYHDRLGPGTTEPTLDFVQQVGARVWQQFVITWSRQFDPAYWAQLRGRVAAARARPGLAELFVGGYLMESVARPTMSQTPIRADLWRWMAYRYPDTSFRPMTVQTVNGRRWQAHWFNYDAMLGIGRGQWGGENSVPNLQKQEGVLYYLYAAREMIDAGMNVVQLAQPHLTFGQGRPAGGGRELEAVTLFVKNYGACRAPAYRGQRFALASVATIYSSLRASTQYVDYAMAPASTDVHGVGLPWNTLADAMRALPPRSVALAGKPFLLQLDNAGDARDHVSVFAHATPAARNAWLVSYDRFVAQNPGYYLAMPGLRPMTPANSQNYTGYARPAAGVQPSFLFVPFDAQGDTARTIAGIFAPR